jgi:hypothetical protein
MPHPRLTHHDRVAFLDDLAIAEAVVALRPAREVQRPVEGERACVVPRACLGDKIFVMLAVPKCN